MVISFLVFKNLNRSTQLLLMGYATTSSYPTTGTTNGSAAAKLRATSTVSSLSRRLGARVPKQLRYLADMSTPYAPQTDVPYFWDIHMAGETVAESVFYKCHGLVQACEHGLKQPDFQANQLQVFENPKGNTGELYVNVDMRSKQGIQRAKKLGLTKQKASNNNNNKMLSDMVVISPQLHWIASLLLDKRHKGRFFALIRNPIDRAVSMYHYLGKASWDPHYNPKLNSMSLEYYATKSGAVENNWMTRFLVDKHGGPLTRSDMLVAKETLRTKCLIGLFEDLEASLERFQLYFGWPGGDDAKQCRSAVVQTGDFRLTHPELPTTSETYKALLRANQWDMELYNYAKTLYKIQGEQVFGLTD